MASRGNKMTFINKNNHYKEANFWRAYLQAREEQKQIMQADNVPAISALTQPTLVSQVNTTIFTQADRGHNRVEMRKIQQIYGELNKWAQVKGFAV